MSPELICGTAGQTSPQTVDWLRSRIFHNVDANSDSSFNLISISLLDLLFHGYPWKIPVRHVITSCTGQSPCLVELHGTHFSLPFLVSRIKANLNSPYDDVVPGFPGHSESFGLGYVSCVCVCFVYLFALKPNGLPLTDPPILVALISTDAVSNLVPDEVESGGQGQG